MTFCDEHDGGCGCSLTSSDYEAGFCTQCKRQLPTKEIRTMKAKTIAEYNELNLAHVSCVIARYKLTDEEWDATPERLQRELLRECAERDDA